jgi:hypothetical protein
MSGPDREKEENNDDDKRKRREEEMRKKKSNGTSSKLELACRETPFAIKRWKPREVLKRIQRQQQPTHTRLDENNKKKCSPSKIASSKMPVLLHYFTINHRRYNAGM